MRLIDADELLKNDVGRIMGFRECDIKNAPTVNAIPTSVLDKIRAEIMSKDGLEEALEIIDKYKSESEE